MSQVIPDFIPVLEQSLKENPHFIHAVLGPRQVGKTTGILTLLKANAEPHLYVSADAAVSPKASWIDERWAEACAKGATTILVLDEIQRIPQWSNSLKALWDKQAAEKKTAIRVILIGSSLLGFRQGLQEHLAGRYKWIRAFHWSLKKTRELIHLDWQRALSESGYPGSYSMLNKPLQFRKHIRDSIVEAVIAKDILTPGAVEKPSTFRQAWVVLSSHPVEEISFSKLLAQMQDAGNTDVIRNYVHLYESSFLIKTIYKYSPEPVPKPTSAPKIIPLCGALIDREAVAQKDGMARAFEAAVGACLINHGFDISYWREGENAVDFVTTVNNKLVALEVRPKTKGPNQGLVEFTSVYKQARSVVITESNAEKFLLDPGAFLKGVV